MLRASIIILITNISICYEILSVPFTGIDLALSGGGRSIERNKSYGSEYTSVLSDTSNVYGYTFVRYPASINYLGIYALSSKRAYHIAMLDYGRLKDGLTENTFGAFDFLIETGKSSIAFNRFRVGYRLGLVFSNIASFYSSSIYSSFSARTRIANDRLGMSGSINNISLLISESESYGSDVPITGAFSLYYRPQYFSGLIALDIKYFSDIEKFASVVTSQVDLSKRVTVFMSLSSSKRDLHVGDVGMDFFAGTGLGIEYMFKKYAISIGIRNQGSSGIVSGLTVRSY